MSGRANDGSFGRDTMTRFMGLIVIVIVMGIQFALAGCALS